MNTCGRFSRAAWPSSAKRCGAAQATDPGRLLESADVRGRAFMDIDRTTPTGLTDLTLTGAAAAVLLGNFADAMITLVLLQLGQVQELNPLMRWAYQISPLAFMVAKLAVVG